MDPYDEAQSYIDTRRNLQNETDMLFRTAIFLLALLLGFLALIGFVLRAISDHLDDESVHKKRMKTVGNYFLGLPVVIIFFILAYVLYTVAPNRYVIKHRLGLEKRGYVGR